MSAHTFFEEPPPSCMFSFTFLGTPSPARVHILFEWPPVGPIVRLKVEGAHPARIGHILRLSVDRLVK